MGIGFHPQPITTGYNPELVSAFVDWMYLKRNQGLELRLTALHDAGCRNGVIKVYIGVYSGEQWCKHMKISKKNVESILDGLD